MDSESIKFEPREATTQSISLFYELLAKIGTKCEPTMVGCVVQNYLRKLLTKGARILEWNASRKITWLDDL